MSLPAGASYTLEVPMPSRAPLCLLAAAVSLACASPARAGEAKATAGAKGKASVVLMSKNGWHVNEQAPVKLKLKPGAGVAIDKPALNRKDLAASTKDSARFDVAFTAAEPGKKTIDAEASFVICQDTACKPITNHKVVIALDVAPAKK
jgi:hypothetical protein